MARKKAASPDEQHVSGGPSNETWSEWIRKATISKRVIDEATGAHRSVLKASKAAGCNPKVVMQAVQAKRMDESTVITDLRQYVQALNAHNIQITAAVIFTGWQPPGKSEGDDFDAEASGYAAGADGADEEMNPHFHDDDQFDAWEQGRQRGAAAADAAAAPGSKAASAKRGRMPTTASADAGAAVASVRRGGGPKPKMASPPDAEPQEWPSGVSGTA